MEGETIITALSLIGTLADSFGGIGGYAMANINSVIPITRQGQIKR